jgi:predicted ATP-dependent serine protease
MPQVWHEVNPFQKNIKAKGMKMYTCPMHPEVEAKKPGKCPKCGMTLQEKKNTTPNAKMKMD